MKELPHQQFKKSFIRASALIAFMSSPLTAAVLVDINADGTLRDATIAEFEDATGLASGSFSGSSLTHIDFNGSNTTPPTTTIRSGTADSITVTATSTVTDYTIGGDADGWFGGGTSPNNLLEDGVFMRHDGPGADPSGTLTLSGSGLGLLANTTYDLYLFAGRTQGHLTTFTFDVNDPTDPSGGSTLAAGVPIVGGDETLGTVQFTFTTGSTAPSQLVIGWDAQENTNGNQDAVFSGFALNAVPEPSAALLLMMSLMVLMRRRR